MDGTFSLLVIKINCVILLFNFSINFKIYNFQAGKGFALSASNKLVACACSNGIVQLFASETLKYEGSVTYSKDKTGQGESDLVCYTKAAEKGVQVLAALPDAIACQFSTSDKLGEH